MRRAANEMLKSLKDQVRGVRYSIRAEAEAPGSTLPKALHDLGPVMAIGVPALRLADGLFTEVETLATGLLAPAVAEPGFPRAIPFYLDRAQSLSDQLYPAYKEILSGRGVRAMLISEQALDRAGERFRDRQSDSYPLTGPVRADIAVKAGAALACALSEARPIRKVTVGSVTTTGQNFMLSPNLHCAMVVGIAAALVTLRPELAQDTKTLLDSTNSVVDVRFNRFHRALLAKSPEVAVAQEFQVLLPFLP